MPFAVVFEPHGEILLVVDEIDERVVEVGDVALRLLAMGSKEETHQVTHCLDMPVGSIFLYLIPTLVWNPLSAGMEKIRHGALLIFILWC